MKREIKTDKAPAAIGPYSQAVRIGTHLFCSGQIALDPGSGEVVEGDIKAQTRRVFANLKAVVEEAGLGMDNIVKTTVYLTDLGLFAEMNEIYGEFFTEPFPARATVEVSGLPKGVLVEIDAIAGVE